MVMVPPFAAHYSEIGIDFAGSLTTGRCEIAKQRKTAQFLKNYLD
jgi:hypothetical protein